MLYFILIGQLLSYEKSGNVLMTNIPKLGTTEIMDVEKKSDDYDEIIAYYGKIYGVDPELVKLIIEKESKFNPRAVSKSGAMGLMQLMPETAQKLGVRDPFDPRQNIEGGIRFLRNLFDMFGGDLELTLAAYHAGPGIVKRENRIPPIPATIVYVDYILSRYGARPKKELYFLITEEGTPLLTNRPK
uniref:Lytic transglycosylase domain-containing protein n=1 Tax=candidate division WOR-3 bacterium TaxID=2052148 RepID=A0A7C4TCX9_UNCW3